MTDDYGILTENDLAGYTLNANPRPFSSDENSGAYNYWQCFPRDHVSVKFEDMGYSSENIGWKDTLAEMIITVWIKPGVFHEYEVRGNKQEVYGWVFDKIKTKKGCASYFDGDCDRTYVKRIQKVA